MSDPVASIVIPTYNQRPELLSAAILSATRQTVPVEVVVVDDGSTSPVAVPEGVRLLRHETNRGISAAMNTGIRASTAPWICWLSSDDEIAPYKVECQRATLDMAGSRCGFHSYYRIATSIMDERQDWSFYHAREPDRGWPVEQSLTPMWGPDQHHAQRVMLGSDCMINGSTVMVLRSVLDEVGILDESLRYGQDCDLCHGSRTFPLGVRKYGTNLTVAIERDPELRRVRDEEDRLIRRRYRT